MKPPVAALGMSLLLAACASNPDRKPVIYRQLDSASLMAPNHGPDKDHVPFVYNAPSADLARYRQVELSPAMVYQGQDAQFGKLSAAQRQHLADYMDKQFGKALAHRYTMVNQPGPDTLLVKLTLTGATTSTEGLSTLRQILPIGAVTGLIKSAADSPSRALGTVTYVVEAYDAQTHRLLRSFVCLQYPAAENIAASLGALHAAETGIDKGASALPAELR